MRKRLRYRSGLYVVISQACGRFVCLMLRGQRTYKHLAVYAVARFGLLLLLLVCVSFTIIGQP